MSDRPQAGNTFWNDAGEDFEIAEVVQDLEDGVFEVVDNDGETANIRWNKEDERWEVDT